MEGSYQSGMKIGKWKILFRDDSSTEFQEMYFIILFLEARVNIMIVVIKLMNG